jgi:signal transduction histidine kinase
MSFYWNGHLDQVRDLLEQTRRDAQALRAADRRKDEFLGMLAHELRNPLSSGAHAAMLLIEGANENERSWAAEVINRQVVHLSRRV